MSYHIAVDDIHFWVSEGFRAVPRYVRCFQIMSSLAHSQETRISSFFLRVGFYVAENVISLDHKGDL